MLERAIDKRMYAIAPSLLALIGNLGQVQWTYAAPDGTAVTRSVTLEEVDQALPDWIEACNLDCHQDSSEVGTDWTPESVKDYAASPAALQRLMDLTCLRLLCGHGRRWSLPFFNPGRNSKTASEVPRLKGDGALLLCR